MNTAKRTQQSKTLASTVQSLTQHTNPKKWLADTQLHTHAEHNSAVHTPTGVSVVDGGGETPGPIPNPEAKPARADGTAPGREWESRLPPTQQLHTQHPPQDTTSCGGCLLFVLHATPFTAARAALWGLSSKKCVCYRRVGGLDVTLLSRFPRDRTCSRYANGPTTGVTSLSVV